MPQALDRCVSALQARGVSDSSAYAICTVATRRSDARERERVAIGGEYGDWARRVDLPESLRQGFSDVYPTISAADRSLMRQLRRVTLTDREGVLGLARLHSRIIAINPDSLRKVGNKPIWHAAVGLHEAVHAVRGMGEHEATQIEQRYAGNRFGEATLRYDRQLMNDAFRIAAMAQGQREIDVRNRERRNDFEFLSGTGFTPRMARKILAIGSRVGNRMRESVAIRRASKSFVTKQYGFVFDDPAINDSIEKALTGEFEKMLLGAVGDEVLKTEGSRYVPDYETFMDGSASAAAEFEKHVAIAVDRGLPREYLIGIVPAIRRANYDSTKLSADDCTRRDSELRHIISQAAVEGLETDDGSPTDPYVIMVMHGFMPKTMISEDANDGSTQEKGGSQG